MSMQELASLALLMIGIPKDLQQRRLLGDKAALDLWVLSLNAFGVVRCAIE